METYSEFLSRIDSFEKRELRLPDGDFKVSPSVALKVNGDNTFRDFYGDTVVFALDDQTKNLLGGKVDFLYRAAPKCFCERLVPHTFHMTLHDLSASPELKTVAEQTFLNEIAVVENAAEICKASASSIRMKSKYIFNMVNTSLVLGLYPADDGEYNKLMALYAIFDGIKTLGYPLTPHITLAYYNVNGFSAHDAAKLEKAVNALNAEPEFEIVLSKLYYQKFTSMNRYVDIIDLTGNAPAPNVG